MNYKELVNDFTPRFINNNHEYDLHVKRLDEILDILIDRDHTEDESDYLSLLGMVIGNYEEGFDEEFELKGFRLIKAVLEDKYYNFIYWLKSGK